MLLMPDSQPLEFIVDDRLRRYRLFASPGDGRIGSASTNNNMASMQAICHVPGIVES
jgi:hypothetical protein